MKNKTSQALYAYWNDVRAGRLAPRRFEIEPARIGTILSDTFILEQSGGKFIYRLAGSRVGERLGDDLRGKDMLDGWSEGQREVVQRHLAVVAEQGAALLLTIEVTSASGATASLEAIILPLVHTRDRIERLLGAVSAQPEPAWLGSDPVVDRRITGSQLIWPDGRPHALLAKSDRQAPFLPYIRNGRLVRQNRRQFRVYDGGLSTTDKSPLDR